MIGGRYRLRERIGRGGMATVFRAHDEQLDRAVAIKLMRADLGDDRQFVRRFSAEARRAASVSHPNVVAVYDYGAAENPYIVMELVDGGDVATLVRRQGRLDPSRAARVAADAADALDAAHAAGLVHRDVKPGNLLIGRDGRVRVADFGIARATGEDTMTRTGATLGSVDYFSPEQARGERVGPASDVYALGVVLYELLTGRRPFTGDTPYAVATARLDRPAPDPRDVVPDLSAELAGIVTRAMAASADDRFRSAGEMAEALRAWITAEDSRTATAAAGGAALGGGLPGSAVRGGVPGVATGSEARTAARRDRNEGAPAAAARSRRQGAWLAALLLVVLVGVGVVAAGLLGGGEQGLSGVVVGSPGGQALAERTPSPAPRTATPTMAAPTATPAADTSPPATPTPQPPTPAPAQPRPEPTPLIVAATTPTDAVAAFYEFVEAGRFDEAYALWSDRMKADHPRSANLDERFAQTVDIAFDTLFVARQSGGTATVQANFTEAYVGGSTRRFVGYWELVQVDGRWLLDHPTY